ncbi:hypothetical protein BUY46_03490 [Staphylococcus devriesei]|nr:hypothetical protein BUY46_03490 [Staphylococcus devriesei]
MIINRGPIVNIDNHQYIFDYSACKHPVGVVENQIYYFNEENISNVIFEGYSDQEETRFQEVGLLEQVRTGFNRPNKLYLHDIERTAKQYELLIKREA